MFKKFFSFVFSLVFLFGVVSSANAVQCDCNESKGSGKVLNKNCTACTYTGCSMPDATWSCVAAATPPASGGSIDLPNPLENAGITTPQGLIARVIKTVIGIVGAVALLMFIYGGFLWLTAAGSPERVKKGQQVIVWAVLGLGVIFTSYGLVRFVLTSLTGKA